jgi:Ig-like domain from next to BRCA1 gene/Fibronectin type III domain
MVMHRVLVGLTTVVLAVSGVVTSVPAATAATTPTAAAAVPPVKALGAVATTATSTTLRWRYPSSTRVNAVVLRRALGSVTFDTPSTGAFVATLARPTSSFTITGLKADTAYTFAVFAATSAGGQVATATTIQLRTKTKPLALTTRSLTSAIAGLPYQQQLLVTGGRGPYSWSASKLPSGITLSKSGALTGTPRHAATAKVVARVTDQLHHSRSVVLSLQTKSVLPAACVAHLTCTVLKSQRQTVTVSAARVLKVSHSHSGAVAGVVIRGSLAKTAKVVVLRASTLLPSGLIGVVLSNHRNANGTTTLRTRTTSPVTAFYQGAIHTTGTTSSDGIGQTQAGLVGPTEARALSAGSRLSCSGSVTSDLHGLDIQHTLTPSIAAIWKHPLIGLGGVYIGTGGLTLFQADLDATITVDLGVSISGAATCTLALPAVHKILPADDLGVVTLDVVPTLTLNVTGKATIDTSVTFHCGTTYRWDNGAVSTPHYCAANYQPLQLHADSGVDASLTGTLDTKVTLDDLVGIKGTVSATVHAGYHPASHPQAELDANASYNLSACLGCWLKNGGQVSIAHGTIWSATLATYDTPANTTGPTGGTTPVVGTTPVGGTPGGGTPPAVHDCASFVADVTIPDGTVVSPSQIVHKVWRLRNCGNTNWSGLTAVRIGGDYGPDSFAVPTVAPGATVDLGVDVQATANPGNDQATYRLQAADGHYADNSFWIIVDVAGTPAAGHDCVGFVTDVTVPDGTAVSPSQVVHKVWRLSNCGTTDWSGLTAIRTGGDYGPASFAVPTVTPGGTVDLAVDIEVPANPGADQATYRLQAADGHYADNSFWVLVNVVSAAVPSYAYQVYNAPTVNLRSGPSAGANLVGTVARGQTVNVVCQAHGQRVLSETDIWDRLDNGAWIYDEYVTTPNIGQFSPPIPAC